MNSKEIKAYQCEKCGSSYIDKNVADNCCQPKLCEDCGIEIPKNHYYVVCDKCRVKREEKKELDRYNKATKYTFESAPKESTKIIYSELYPYNEGFMYDIEDEDIEKYEIKYVYGTKRISPHYDAWDMVEYMLEDSYEDSDDQVDNKELEKLQSAIDTFIKNHNGCLDHFEIDYNVAIDL